MSPRRRIEMSLSPSSFSPFAINTHAYVSHVNATHTRTATLHYSLTLSPSNWNNSIYGHSSRPPWLRPLCMEPPPLLTKERENLPAGSPNDTHTKPISCQENTSRSTTFGQNRHPCGVFSFFSFFKNHWIWVDGTSTITLIWHVQLLLLEFYTGARSF